VVDRNRTNGNGREINDPAASWNWNFSSKSRASASTKAIETMKDLSSFIIEADEIRGSVEGATVSIVFPGTSVEGMDLSRLEGTTTITMNEMIGRVETDYALVLNERTISSVMFYFRHRPETRLVVSSEVVKRLEDNPPFDYRTGIGCVDMLSGLNGVVGWFTGSSIAVAALDFAEWIGASRVDLYGLDLCSPLNRTHAYGVKRLADRDGTMVSEGLFRFDQWESARHEIELAATTKWSNMEITNKSEISTLECFPKGA